MPIRMLRDWTTSEKIDKLSEKAEVFFTRLIMKADDHGCFHAHPKLLKAALFPLKNYSDALIESCLDELAYLEIVKIYEHEGRRYLKIYDFGQRLRTMVSKFPQPDDKVPSIVSNKPPELEEKRREVEENTKPKAADAPVITKLPFGSNEFWQAWVSWERYKKERKQKFTDSTKEKQLRKLGARTEKEAIAMINQSIENGWTGLFDLKQNGNGKSILGTKQQQTIDTAKAVAELYGDVLGKGQSG